jgi:hypothetical protein
MGIGVRPEVGDDGGTPPVSGSERGVRERGPSWAADGVPGARELQRSV